MNSLIDRVTTLVGECERAPGEPLPAGATAKQLEGVEGRLGFKLPEELWAFLTRVNGPCVGPGGLFGIDTARDYLNMERMLEVYPRWRMRRWLPVASDGVGNYYVLVCGRSPAPVGFVDTMEDPYRISYIVASRYLLFVAGVLSRELGIWSSWPFEREAVLAEDSAMRRLERDGEPMPWSSDTT